MVTSHKAPQKPQKMRGCAAQAARSQPQRGCCCTAPLPPLCSSEPHGSTTSSSSIEREEHRIVENRAAASGKDARDLGPDGGNGPAPPRGAAQQEHEHSAVINALQLQAAWCWQRHAAGQSRCCVTREAARLGRARTERGRRSCTSGRQRCTSMPTATTACHM